MNILVAIVFLFSLSVRALSQEVILTRPPGGIVMWNDSVVGTAPYLVNGIHPGDTVFVYPPDTTVWNPPGVPVNVRNADDTIVVRLPAVKRLESIPFGAKILLGDSVVATTPAQIAVPGDSLTVGLLLFGFADTTITIRYEEDVPPVILKPLAGFNAPVFVNERETVLTLPGWKVVLPSVAGLASGIAAVLFKSRANDYYDRYRQTRDPAELDNTRRFDILSGISLVIMEASMAWLVYYILSES